MDVHRLPAHRPPGSPAEAAVASYVRRRLESAGVRTDVQRFRTTTSPSWVHMLAATMRLAAAAMLVAGIAGAAVVLAGLSTIASVRPRLAAAVVRTLPALGSDSQNVVGRVDGTAGVVDPPLVVIAHLDTHPTAGAPLGTLHVLLSAVVAVGLLVIAVASLGASDGASGFLAFIALEPAATLAWIANGELVPRPAPRDDNASGLAALARVAELVGGERPERTVWIVATGAATAGGRGIAAFLRRHRDTARTSWIIELDALGSSEIVLTPGRRRFPRATTPPAVVRAVAGAALETGDLIDVRRVRRPHSDANVATAAGTPALTLTAGMNTLGGPDEPDPANSERAAQIVDRLARTIL